MFHGQGECFFYESIKPLSNPLTRAVTPTNTHIHVCMYKTTTVTIAHARRGLILERKMSDNSLSGCKVCRSQIGKYIICMWLCLPP